MPGAGFNLDFTFKKQIRRLRTGKAIAHASTEVYSKRQIYLPFTIAASGGCERARKEISRFAARDWRGENIQNEIRFDVYDIPWWRR